MRRMLLTASVAVLLAMAGCGSQDDGDSSTDGAMKAAVVQNSDAAPIPFGVQKGIFADHGIDLKVETGQGGSALIAGVVSGDYDFVYTGTVSYMQAREQGVKLHVLSGAGTMTKEASDEHSGGALLVTGSSPIKELADLEGKTVGVNAVKGVLEIAVTNRLLQAGVDPEKVTFVEIPIPGMLDALKNGTVDALAISEPFRTIAEDRGDLALVDIYSGFKYPFMTSLYVTSQAQYDANPKLFDKVAVALDETLADAQENQADVRAILPDFAGLDQDIAQRITLPYWTSEVNVDSAREQAEIAVKIGALPKKPDIDELFKGTSD